MVEELHSYIAILTRNKLKLYFHIIEIAPSNTIQDKEHHLSVIS